MVHQNTIIAESLAEKNAYFEKRLAERLVQLKDRSSRGLNTQLE